ncbi:tRNA pseudouridine(55) synthase TruB [Youngiibacter fragilis]|uniref:tRNA pseudouridine synthase B n=1 Tax=Youngiibacter fragilis 232.1 TaxID=994573 RepID=V7I6Z1_9CLOT|nr:tRNA pseudouridine(55) synthase TruB [Youngiibacter fragilis]ETA81985.1 tRNA pseudouridine synthase B [Youngiibacter fragilis 232.1]
MDGVINIFKQKGETSFKCVSRVRKALNVKKAGHTGTLDPEAEGVLPICVGRATKLVDHIMGKEKTYVAGFELGLVSDTLDAFGEVTATYAVIPPEDEVKKTFAKHIGKTLQTPPMYSALKKDGVRLYELARNGIEIEREAREIEITSIELLSFDGRKGSVRVDCGKGTYIRSLIDDVGRELSCGAIMTSLMRERTGPFSLENSVTVEVLADEPEKHLIPMEEVLSEYDSLIIPEGFRKLLVNGVKIRDTRVTGMAKAGTYRVYSEEGVFLGLGERLEDFFYLKLNLV